MDEQQLITQSRTIITLVIGLLAPLVAAAGYKFENVDQAALVNALALIWCGGSMVVGMYYRVIATKKIVPKAQLGPPVS